jgi:hypothetical protein
MLGKIFKTTRLPLKSAMLISFKPAPTNLKSGAVVPTAGKLPFVFTSDPLNVTVAIFVLFFLIISYHFSFYFITLSLLFCLFL